MYKNLSAECLGISGRQNELIELALTYKFKGLDLDFQTLAQQITERGRDHAMRFLNSADIKIGCFELPLQCDADEETYRTGLTSLEQTAELAAQIGATRCTTTVRPFSVGRPYHEDFELHRKRYNEIADLLKPHGILLGIGFLAPTSHREGYPGQFIATADAMQTLIRMLAADNAGLCLDLWHWTVGGGTVEQIKQFDPKRIVTVRVADLPVDYDPATVTEESRLLPGTTRVVPATEVLQWLTEVGYDGPLTPCCHSSQMAGATRTQVVERAVEALRQTLKPAPVADETEAGEPAAVR